MNKYALCCPHCKSAAEDRHAMRSSHSEPMICEQCGSPSWFKAPNGVPYLTVALVIVVLGLPRVLSWPVLVSWIFIGIAMPLILMGDRFLTWRFGHMVWLPVHPVRQGRKK